MNKTITFARLRHDGTLEALEAPPVVPIQPMMPRSRSREPRAVEPRAVAQLLITEDFRNMRTVPRVEMLRHRFALSQEEFAIRYHIPLGTLRDWEENRSEPDEPMCAYLTVIARHPEVVRRALRVRPKAENTSKSG